MPSIPQSQSQHTPGPWRRAGVTQIATGRGTYCYAQGNYADGARAHLTVHGTAADARLITAAPDLLAACEAMTEYIGGQWPDDPDNEPGFVAEARAAIAKATGREGGGA